MSETIRFLAVYYIITAVVLAIACKLAIKWYMAADERKARVNWRKV